MTLPEKLRDLQLAVGGQPQALLTRRSVYSLVYQPDAQHQVGLGLPVADRVFQDGDLFAALDMNLPEGYLFEHAPTCWPAAAALPCSKSWSMPSWAPAPGWPASSPR